MGSYLQWWRTPGNHGDVSYSIFMGRYGNLARYLAMSIAFVQQKAEQSTSSVSSFTTTTSMNVGVSNAIVMCIAGSIVSLSSLVASDSQGNAYILARFAAGSPSAGSLSIYVAPRVAGGATFFTATPNISSFVTICAQEYSGLQNITPTEVTGQNAASSVSSIVAPAMTPPSDNDLYISCWTHDGSASQTCTFDATGEGWQARSNLSNTANQPLFSQDLVASGTKKGSFTGGTPATYAWLVLGATFRAADMTRAHPTRPFAYKPGVSNMSR